MMPHDNDETKPDNVVNIPAQSPIRKHDDNESTEINQPINVLKTKHGLNDDPNKQAKATNDGVKAGIELLTPIVVCFFIGMGLDNWLDKSPLFLMLFFVLGVITGFWNIYKLTK